MLPKNSLAGSKRRPTPGQVFGIYVDTNRIIDRERGRERDREREREKPQIRTTPVNMVHFEEVVNKHRLNKTI